MLSEVLIILALVLVNGLFSGAEIAILSIRRTRLAELVDEGRGSARAVARLRDHPERFLATVQVGITVVSAAAAAFGGSSIAVELAPVIGALPGLSTYSDDIALAIVVVGVSTLSIVLGELVPKSLALRAGESYALLVGRPLEGLAWAGRPFIAALTAASNVVLRVFGDRTTFTEARLSREEIQQIVDEAATSGSVGPHAGEIASRALEFDTLDAATIMVPRPEVVMLPKDATAEDAAQLARERGHGRVPVYDGSPDNVIGFVNLRDVLAQAVTSPSLSLDALIHPLPSIPWGMAAPAVLRRLQDVRARLGLVIDEHGTILGLVTVEDLLEELVGDLFSENDPRASPVSAEPDGTWLVAGAAPLRDVARQTGIDLPEGDYTTIAGLCLELAGAIPAAGTTLRIPGVVVLEVLDATPRRVRRVRLTAARHPPRSAPAG